MALWPEFDTCVSDCSWHFLYCDFYILLFAQSFPFHCTSSVSKFPNLDSSFSTKTLFSGVKSEVSHQAARRGSADYSPRPLQVVELEAGPGNLRTGLFFIVSGSRSSEVKALATLTAPELRPPGADCEWSPRRVVAACS